MQKDSPRPHRVHSAGAGLCPAVISTGCHINKPVPNGVKYMQEENEPVIEVREEMGVQEASNTTTAASTPIQIEEVELLRYRLAGSEHSKAQLVVEMCHREMQHAQIDLAAKTQEIRKLVSTLESKYKFSLQTHIITDDGYLVPRPM